MPSSHGRGFRAVLLTAITCAGVGTIVASSTVDPNPGVEDCTLRLRIESGNAQTGTTGAALPDALVVAVAEDRDTPPGCNPLGINGRAVEWTSASGTFSSARTMPDAAGYASTTWTLGAVPGAQTAVAELALGDFITRVQFTATATPPTPYYALRKVAGDTQAAPAGSRLPVRPQIVLVRVQQPGPIETPVGGTPLGWSIQSGGGRVLPEPLTDENGRAGAEWDLGPSAGPQTLHVTASRPALPSSPSSDPRDTLQVDFTATALSQPYVVLRSVAGDNQSAPPGGQLPNPTQIVLLQVQAETRTETPIGGGTVGWSVRSGTGRVDRATGVTDQLGQSIARWTLGPETGVQTLRASVLNLGPSGSGVGSRSPSPNDTLLVDFTATATASPVRRVAITPSSLTIPIGNTASFTARAFDSVTAGNELTGRAVAWTVSPSIATLSPASPATSPSPIVVKADASGDATLTATSEGVTGTAVIHIPSPPPARVAYALADKPTTSSYSPDQNYSYNSATGDITISRTGVGMYHVTFPNQQTPTGSSETILVSSYGSTNGYCRLGASWTSLGTGPLPGLTANVNCFAFLGAPNDDQFTILLLGEAALPGRFAFARFAPPAPTTSYNSSGQPVTVNGTFGSYQMRFAGDARRSTDGAEAILVTPLGTGSPAAASARCTVSSFMIVDQIILQCFDGTVDSSNPLDSPLSASLIEKGQPGKRFGLAAVPIMRGPGTMTLSPAEATNSASGLITVSWTNTGLTHVRFAGLARAGASDKETVQILAADGPYASYCKAQGWMSQGTDLVVDVQCWHEDGAITNSGYYIAVIQ
jgi:hypothetical protein